MDPQAPQESQALWGKMDYLAFQVQKDSRGCLVLEVFLEKEEGQDQRDHQAEREKLERRVYLVVWDIRAQEVLKA